MNFKYIVLIIVGLIILVLMNGCERGVGREPVAVKNVTEDNLIGTWVLSQKYTDKRVLQKLKHNINEYYFQVMPNQELKYHSFAREKGFGQLSMLNSDKGRWKLNRNNIILKNYIIQKIYISANGWESANPNSSNLVEPIRTEDSPRFVYLHELRFTQKNGKLLLWYYNGDPDARRYIMYEKKE